MSLLNVNLNWDFNSLINLTKQYFRKEDDNNIALNALHDIFANCDFPILQLIDFLVSTDNQWNIEYSLIYPHDVVWLEKKKLPYNGTKESLFQIKDVLTDSYQVHEYLKDIRINPIVFPFVSKVWNSSEKQRLDSQGGNMNV